MDAQNAGFGSSTRERMGNDFIGIPCATSRGCSKEFQHLQSNRLKLFGPQNCSPSFVLARGNPCLSFCLLAGACDAKRACIGERRFHRSRNPTHGPAMPDGVAKSPRYRSQPPPLRLSCLPSASHETPPPIFGGGTRHEHAWSVFSPKRDTLAWPL